MNDDGLAWSILFPRKYFFAFLRLFSRFYTSLFQILRPSCWLVPVCFVPVLCLAACSEDRYHSYEFEREPSTDGDQDPDSLPEDDSEEDSDVDLIDFDGTEDDETIIGDVTLFCEQTLQYCASDPLFFDGTERCERKEVNGKIYWERILCVSSSTYDPYSKICRNTAEVRTLEMCPYGCSPDGSRTRCDRIFTGTIDWGIADDPGGDQDEDVEEEQVLPVPNRETLCSTDNWCWSDARPFGGSVYNVYAPDPSHVWLVGDMGLVFYDGESWVEAPVVRYKVPRDLAGLNKDNVWVVGDNCFVAHWKGDGSPFWRTSNPVSDGDDIDLKAVDMVQYSYNDGVYDWDVNAMITVGSPRKILLFEGKTRESSNPPGTVQQDVWSVIEPPDENRLVFQDVCQFGRMDFWVVADEVWLYHHDPETGWDEPRHHHSRVNAIQCSLDGDLLIAESSLQGYSLRYLSRWDTFDELRSVDKEITRIISKDDGRLAATTVGGLVLRWQGGRWIEDLLVYAPTGTFPNLYGMDWDEEGNFWAVGDQVYQLPAEDDWQAVTTGMDLPWRTICAMNELELWAAGDQGRLARYDGESWSLEPSVQNETLRASIAVPANRTEDSTEPYVFFGGDNATLLGYNGNSWLTYPNPNGSDGPVLQEGAWRDLWYDEETQELWAVGDDGWIIHGDFKTWNYISTPILDCTMGAIWGARSSGSLMIYAGGDKPGCFYRYDGRTLNFVGEADAPTQNIVDIGGTGFQSVYVTTTTGLYRYGGWSWNMDRELSEGRHFLFTSALEQHIVSSFDSGRAQSLRRHSTGWTRSELLYGGELFDMVGVSYFDTTAQRYIVWAVGEHGILMRHPDL